MTEILRIGPWNPALLEFSGPDAVRYLNGQLTQDVRLVAKKEISLPSCVTDAKGKLQFRVTLTETDSGKIWIEAPQDHADALEARLTRYLIADDAEALNLTGKFYLCHWIGPVPVTPSGVMARKSNRLGVDGVDWWWPQEMPLELPDGEKILAGDELEAFRIFHGAPAWGSELVEGILPPEAGLDASDISYHKGCYIGQEVISRIKSAGKLNKRLVHLAFNAEIPTHGLQLVDAAGSPAGSFTSISPHVQDGLRHALAFLKRGVDEIFTLDSNHQKVRLFRF